MRKVKQRYEMYIFDLDDDFLFLISVSSSMRGLRQISEGVPEIFTIRSEK